MGTLIGGSLLFPTLALLLKLLLAPTGGTTELDENDPGVNVGEMAEELAVMQLEVHPSEPESSLSLPFKATLSTALLKLMSTLTSRFTNRS
jgi:hypothetical protein